MLKYKFGMLTYLRYNEHNHSFFYIFVLKQILMSFRYVCSGGFAGYGQATFKILKQYFQISSTKRR